MITITTFKWVPPFVQGLVRDLRVRWALEEAGLAYQTKFIQLGEQSDPTFRALQPFGQVPAYEEDGLKLFESGAIVLHIGARSEALLPAEENARARAIMWVFAALNTMEVVIQQLAELDLFFADQEWAKTRRPDVEKRMKVRLAELAACLGDREYLEGQFTVGDLMMSAVLRNIRHTDLVASEPKVHAYQARCEARPAFQRALRDQMATFEPAHA